MPYHLDVMVPGLYRMEEIIHTLGDCLMLALYLPFLSAALRTPLTAPFLIYSLGTLLALPLITYGILKSQLFDIDLKIQWTIRQSTVVTAFVAVFYVVTEGADRLFEAELGAWVGLLASALLVFFLAPLQRFAERFAGAVMPNTSDTPEYAAYRKMQVYEAAFTEALPGGISAKERALLNHLRESLGVAVADAEALERDLAG